MSFFPESKLSYQFVDDAVVFFSIRNQGPSGSHPYMSTIGKITKDDRQQPHCIMFVHCFHHPRLAQPFASRTNINRLEQTALTLFIPDAMSSSESLLATTILRIAITKKIYRTTRIPFRISLKKASLSSNSLSDTWNISYGRLHKKHCTTQH